MIPVAKSGIAQRYLGHFALATFNLATQIIHLSGKHL